MPITITKTKAAKPNKLAPVEKEEPEKLSDEDLADLYGSLEDKAEAAMQSPVFVQFREAKAELQKRLDTFEHDDEVKFKGSHWIVTAGVCSKSPRKILDNGAVAKFMGKEDFMKVAKVSVGDAEKYLTPDQVAVVVSKEEFTKNRKVVSSFLG